MNQTATEITTSEPNNQKWRDNVAALKMLSPLLILLMLAGHFHQFVFKSVAANVEINGLILATIGYGTLIILFRLSTAQRDFRLIERFGDETLRGRPMSELVEEPWIKQRYIRHYFKHIAAMETQSSVEANRHAIESELHALSDEYNSRLELPQFLVGFMIALGLLGTFIGLLETLTGIAGMLDSMGGGAEQMDQQFLKLVGELRKPLAGMGIAFSASMFGLVGSLVLAVMMINLRRYVARVLMCARNVMHEIIEDKHIVFAEEHSQPAHDYVAAQGGGISAGTDNSVMMLASRLDMLASKMEGLFRVVETSAAGTVRLNELLGFGPRMKDISERTQEGIKNLVELQQQAQIDSNRKLGNVVEKLGILDESSIAIGGHLWEIRGAMEKLAGAMASQEFLAASASQQTLLTEALLNEIRQTRQWLGQFAATSQRGA